MEFDLSTYISVTRSVPDSFVRTVLQFPEDTSFVTTYEKYDDLFRIRHDYVHWIISQHRGIPFGEKPLIDFPEFKILENYKHWDLIKNQTPDSIIIRGRNIQILEITISSSRLAKKEKITKYALMIDAMKRSGFHVDIEIIVIGSNISEPGVQSLSEEHKFPLEVSNKIYEIVSKFSRLIHSVESTPYGQEWNSRRSGEHFSDVDLKISEEDIIDYHVKSTYKCFESLDELKNMFTHDEFDGQITDQDNIFLDTVVDEALNVELSMSNSHNLSESLIDLRLYHSKHNNSKKCRSFMPLPFLSGLLSDSSNRSTEMDETTFVQFKSLLMTSQDSFFMKLASMSEHRGTLHLSMSEKYNIALEGPGRKQFIKRGSDEHIRRQKINRNYWFDYNSHSYEHELDSLTHILSKVDDLNTNDPNSSKGVGLEMVRCMQSIFREITINAMRSDRRREFIFKPTGVDGVYLLLYPGAKLRTGENLSTIWFKLFSTPDKIMINQLSTHWAFKTWNHSGSFIHTDWISIDANRLDHYLRCFDRILMAYLTYMHFDSGHLLHSIESDTTNVLGVIMLIYMEDKRSTSKMLQDVRYLVMGSLSKFRWWRDLIGKYKEPLRTPLQAYLLKKIERYCIDINDNLILYIKSFKFGKVHQESDIISDRLAGATSSLPRVLTKGGKINFQQLLCEMYFTMLFNKNQDDPTHSTFQILNKMLDGEESLREVKETTRLHMGGDDPFKDLKTLIHQPHKNQFSKYAIMIGSKLQAIDQQNRAPAGLAHKKAAQDKFMNKPLSEFATYKSSAVFERDTFDDRIRTKQVSRKRINKDQLEERFREGGEDDNSDSINTVIPRQNPRRRCIEGVIDLLNKGYLRSYDVIKESVKDEMYFQVFKKNQIGGVREILILPIEKRITINILESFSRLICKFDDREMLTHGNIKFTLMRDMIRDVRRTEKEKRIVLNYNLDKTRWGPSFMPIQFIYMFKPFASNYPSLFRFLLLTLMVHTNKKCMIPEKLIHVWLKDVDNKLKHSEPLLQKLKEKFLEEKRLSFDNESNMGQGILHYTSSYLHLCALSFRDQIYNKLCKRMGISTGSWKDIVSSDDSYTAQAIPMDGIKRIKTRIDLFIRAQEVTERLFNIWTSKSKSSVSFLISEFNSMFGSNLTLFPTLLKFSIASVSPTNTDSFFRMVKESFNTTRQIVENGGSLELYMISHRLNKKFCESIYHTHEGGFNDFSKLNLNRENIPYQLGIYPIKDPGIMIILGPECHNYEIMRRLHELPPKELNLFQSCHNLIPVSNPELYSELNTFDNIFTGMLRIEAATGPVRKLQRIKRQLDMSWEQMQSIIEKDITILLRDPRNMDETKLLTYQKLFSYGASEALRDTAASIYYARVSATVSATAFNIPYHETFRAKYDPQTKKMIGHTYQDCLNFLMDYKNEPQDLDKYYPHMKEYNDLHLLSHNKPTYSKRNQFETQNIRSLQLTEITMRIKNPIRDLIEAFWMNPNNDKTRSLYRDWVILKELIPIIDDSLELTLDSLSGDKTTKIKTLILVLMRIMSYSNRPMKAVIYGQSTRSYDQTYLTLIQQNLFHNYTSTSLIINQNVESNPRIYDRLYYYYNLFQLSVYYNKNIRLKLEDLSFDEFIRDPLISHSTKKRIMMMLMYNGFLDDYNTWTDKTHTIMHYWIKRQHRTHDGEWRGDYRLLMQCGSSKLILSKINKSHYIQLNDLEQPLLNYEMLKSASDLVLTPIEDIVSTMKKGRFLIVNDRIIPIMDPGGVHITLNDIDDIKIDVGSILIQETGEQKFLQLCDVDGYQVMRTTIGLLPTDYIPLDDEIPEFYIDGISIYDLSKIRIFTHSFDFNDLDPNVTTDILPDLVLVRPKISDVTKDRLRGLISQEWETKGMTDYFDEAEGAAIEEKMKLLTDVTITHDEFKTLMKPSDDDPYDQLLDPDFQWDLVSNLPVVRATFQPQKIMERVIFCKYHFIARSCVDPSLLSKHVIKAIYKQTANVNLVYALVYLYDRMYTSRDAPSPITLDISIREKFMKKFLINDDESLEIY